MLNSVSLIIVLIINNRSYDTVIRILLNDVNNLGFKIYLSLIPKLFSFFIRFSLPSISSLILFNDNKQ